DTNTNGKFEAQEIIDADCFFETSGGLDFAMEAFVTVPGTRTPTLSNPNPFTTHRHQIGGFDINLWNAELSSCDPPNNIQAGSLVNGKLRIDGSEMDDEITVT